MKKVFLLIAVVIAIGLAVQINRENAKVNTEAIESLPQQNSNQGVPMTREEIEAMRGN